MSGHGEKRTRKQEAAIAALLTEPTVEAGAAKAGVSYRTLKSWLALPDFQAAYRRARRELMESTITRLQAATGEVVEMLKSVAKNGAKDGDRIRAGIALLDHAFKGTEILDLEERLSAVEEALAKRDQ